MADDAAWRETSEGFRRYLRTRGRSLDTATTYAAHLRPFWTWAQRHDFTLLQARPMDCELYLDDQLTRLSASTAHVRLSALKAFFVWMMEEGEINGSPAAALTVRKDKREPRPPQSDFDVARLMRACKTDEERLLFIVGFGCGLRISELVNLDMSRIFIDTGRMLIKGKGRKERWIAAPPPVLNAIRNYMGVRRGPLFPMRREQARRIMQRIARNAGVEGFYPHRMRITFATRFWKQTNNLKALRTLMGHSDLSTTAQYADYDTQEEALDLMRGLKLGGVA